MPQDVHEAQAIRDEMRQKREAAQQRKPELIERARALATRRGQNHFIDLLNFYAKGH